MAPSTQEDPRGEALPPDDGRLLRVMVASTKSKRALEIGTSNGYSTLWLGLAAVVLIVVVGLIFLIVNREVIFSRGEQSV